MQTQSPNNISSPSVKNQKNDFKLLLTPETNKGKTSSYPLKYSKIKKSKRRDCTPAYSPSHLTEAPKEEQFRFYTDKKGSFTFGKLNLDSNLKLFQPNTEFKADKSNFLQLVEESLNEFNGTFLDALENQTTPDTIFTTLFNDNKENPEKMHQVASKVTQAEIKKAYSDIEEICNGITKGDSSCFISMKPKIIIIDSECNLKEIQLQILENHLIAALINEKDVSPLRDNMIFVSGKMQFDSSLIEEKKLILAEDNKTLCKDVKLIFSIDHNMNVRLSCIEIHCF